MSIGSDWPEPVLDKAYRVGFKRVRKAYRVSLTRTPITRYCYRVGLSAQHDKIQNIVLCLLLVVYRLLGYLVLKLANLYLPTVTCFLRYWCFFLLCFKLLMVVCSIFRQAWFSTYWCVFFTCSSFIRYKSPGILWAIYNPFYLRHIYIRYLKTEWIKKVWYASNKELLRAVSHNFVIIILTIR